MTIDTIGRDVRYALRSLRRAPGVSLVAIGSLAIGVAFALFVFNFVQQALAVTAVPAASSGRLVDVFTSQLDGSPYGTSSFPDLQDIRERTRVFDQVVGYSPYAAAVNIDGSTRLLLGEIVTGNYFDVLGLRVSLGRTLLPSDDRPGAARVAVVSDHLWRAQFGASARAIGRVLRIRNQPYTVVGVASPGYRGAAILPVELWTAMAWAEDADPVGIIETVPSPGRSQLERRGARWLFVRGRLASGQTLASARGAMQALMTGLQTEYPASNARRRFTALDTRTIRVHPAVDFAIVPAGAGLAIVVFLVLAVACANVSGLFVARGAMRLREVAIRFAIGATRARVVRQLLAESILVSAVATSAAMALLWSLTAAARGAVANIGVPFSIDPRVGTPTLWFAVALTLATGIAAGLVPALRTTDRGRLLTLAGSSSAPVLRRRRWSIREMLIVVQTAAAFVLLVTAGLLTRSALASQRVDLGFRTDGVISVSTGTTVLGYDAAKARQFYTQALERIRAIPGVESAALVGRAPFDLSFWNETIFPVDGGRDASAGSTEYAANVSPEYFSVLDVRIVDGRNFAPGDTPSSPRVAIVTQALATKYWRGQSAIGKRFHARTPDGPEYEIVGVSADYKVARPGEPPTPYIHYAIGQAPSTEWQILVRGAAGRLPPIDRVRGELASLDPGLLFDAVSMAAKVKRVLFPLQAAAAGLSAVGLVTIVFAAIGLYGVISFMVARRSQEFGIRIAVGAAPFQVWSFVVRRGLVVAAAGVAIGAIVAGVVATALSRLLYGVRPIDPLTWGMALGIVVAIALLAHALPARRASAVSPIEALRAE